jgi:hypothetical protein
MTGTSTSFRSRPLACNMRSKSTKNICQPKTTTGVSSRAQVPQPCTVP